MEIARSAVFMPYHTSQVMRREAIEERMLELDRDIKKLSQGPVWVKNLNS